MIVLNDLIEQASETDYLGCFGDTEYYSARVVLASDHDGILIHCRLDEWELQPEAVAIRLRKDVPFYEADMMRLQHQIDQLTAERDTARRALEVATQVQNTSYTSQWNEKPRIYQPEDLENMRRVDQSDPPRCSVTGVRMAGPWPCPCSTCADMRRAYQSMDRLNAPASPIAFANGATLTPEQAQDLRRAVADLKQTNSHAVPLAPLLTRICRCEDCEAHRRVLAEGGSITGAPIDDEENIYG